MPDRVGQQLGNYRLTRFIDEGGFAEVYLGEHIYLGTEAAIKVMTTRFNKDELEQFRAEARMIARLKHQHIIRILEFGIEDRTPYLVMDYAPGGTLRKRYASGPRPTPKDILPYVVQVATALQHAHDQKLIHRDIKPENILLETNNQILLSDFGIAVAAHSSKSLNTQNSAGTIYYMAPEQIQGKPRPASDQYSLAIVIYELLCGSRPFTGTSWEVIAQHLTATPTPMKEKIATISPAIEQVIMKALAKDPHQRYGSIMEFARAFEAAVAKASLGMLTFPKKEQRLGFTVGSLTHPGIKERYKPNEDSIFAVQGVRNSTVGPQPFGLFVIADGIISGDSHSIGELSPYSHGQDASRLAIQTITNYMLPILLHNARLSVDGLGNVLRDSVQQAHQAVHKQNIEQRTNMGTTIAAALIENDRAYIANVGDSRIYQLRYKTLRPITRDHSLVARLVESKLIEQEDVYTHPQRDMIYRSLGDKNVEVDIFFETLRSGDKLLLCSDGLWKMVHDPDLQKVLTEQQDPQQICNILIDLANKHGGEENVSVIAVQITDPPNPHNLALDIQFLYSPENYMMPQL